MLEQCLTSSVQSNHGQCQCGPGTMRMSTCLQCSTDFKAALCMPHEIISWSGLKKLGNNQVLNVAQRLNSKKHWARFRDPVPGEHCLVSQAGKPKCIFFPAWCGMSFSEIVFHVFLCSPFHSASYPSVLLCSFLQHLHLTLSHFPNDDCISTI